MSSPRPTLGQRLRALLLPGGWKPTLVWLAVGLGFIGVNSVLLYLLVDLAGLAVGVATLIAAEFATLLRYVINVRWIFVDHRLSWSRLGHYHVANAAGFAVWWIAANGLYHLGLHYQLAGIVAVGASTGFSFLSNFHWVWHRRHAPPAAGRRPVVAGVIVLREDGAALLQHRDDIPTINDPGLWVIPGGHVEAGETAVAGAVREVEEETCYRSRAPRPLAEFHATELGYEGDFQMVFFWDEYDGAQRIECREGQAARFVARAEADGLPRRDYLTRIWDLALDARQACVGRTGPLPS
jgi:8-oxo-dGTP diphosphatase